MLAGVLRPSGGDARLAGVSVAADPEGVKPHLAYMSQRFGLYADLTVAENLDFYADLYRVPRSERAARLERLYAFSNLGPFSDRLAGQLSGGMKQKLGLSCALVHEPEILLLDEPTAALDPVARRAVHAIVERLVERGKTVLLTTHYIEEAEKLCRRVVMVRRGEVVADGSPFELVGRAAGRSTLWIEVDGPFDPAPLLAAGATDQGAEGRHRRFSIADPGAAVVALGDLLRAQGGKLVDLRMKRPTLEDVYLELMGPEEMDAAA
jgi:ABC-2 type transport system ATP-binding protein